MSIFIDINMFENFSEFIPFIQELDKLYVVKPLHQNNTIFESSNNNPIIKNQSTSVKKITLCFETYNISLYHFMLGYKPVYLLKIFDNYGTHEWHMAYTLNGVQLFKEHLYNFIKNTKK